jgi:hypothetical protein
MRAGHRQEWDRRIDALAVEVLVAIGEREAAERRAGELLQTMSTANSSRYGRRSPWLCDTISTRSASLLELARPPEWMWLT